MQSPDPMSKKIYDIIGIGIGPFNLGLAALCQTIPELSCLFIDQNESFNWHPGMMIPGCRLQVPFYADLVTLADPSSPFSFMMFLKAKKRMFRFAIQENYFIKRSEYNDYCQWVAGQLDFLQFNQQCLNISKEKGIYRVQTKTDSFFAKHIVIGTGSVPYVPECARYSDEHVFHSAGYTYKKDLIKGLDSITIVGSGQSAAEIFYDMIQTYTGNLYWFTRSPRFLPMDYSKLTLEMSTPDYIGHFHSIPESKKASILNSQDSLYKGINQSLISDIYDALVEKNSGKIHLHTNCELTKIDAGLNLQFTHHDLETEFVHDTDAVILATGYCQILPEFLDGIRPLIQLGKGIYKANRNYSIDKLNSIFVQNAEQATHGFNAADLSLGPYRNAVILNTILGYEYYSIETDITFQSFGLPKIQRT